MAFKVNKVKNDITSYPHTILIGVPKSGKAQPLNSILKTPKGDVFMKDIKVGDSVFSVDGTPTKVLGVYPQGIKKIYEVIFSDGSKTHCSEEHLWTVQSSKQRRNGDNWDIKELKDILLDYKTKFNRNKYSIPIAKCVEYDDKKININPYLLGVLLGDGYICGNTVTFSTSEQDMVEKISNITNSLNMTIVKCKGHNYSYNIKKKEGEYRNPIKQELIKYGLADKHSYDKFIPKDYIYNSKDIRLQLLKGLMDTDGHISFNGVHGFHYVYATCSEQLKDDIIELVESLGGICTWQKDKRVSGKGNYCYGIRIILNEKIVTTEKHLKRIGNRKNVSRLLRKIKDIKYIGEEDCQCIKVENDSELYLTDNYIVTHNTTLFRDIILEKYKDPEYGLLISLGKEKGYKALDNLMVEEAMEWTKEYGYNEEDLPEELWTRGLVEIVDDLIYNKKDYKFEIIGLDTVDELYELARQRVFYEHKNLKGSYPKSLNDSLGGYGKGKERILDLIFTQLNRLENAGYHVILIGHTKQKDKLDPVTGLNYEQITNNLENKFWESLSGSAQWTINIVKDVNIEDFHTKGSGATEKEVGKITGSERMMYFRDDNPLIDCGGRFKGLPEKLPLSAENFWKAFEIGVENSRTDKITKKEKESEIKKEKETKELIANNQKRIEELTDSERKDELFQSFKQIATAVKESGDDVRIKKFMNLLISNDLTIAKFKELPLSKMLELMKEVKNI